MVQQDTNLTIRAALIMLQAWAHWFRIISTNPKYLPGRGILQRGINSAIKSLESESRNTVLRLARRSQCIFCGREVKTGTGDHIIPLSKGGPQSVENFMPLCKKCNASKGDKDLLEWWFAKGRRIVDLDQDALVIYLRLTYRLNKAKDSPASENLLRAIAQAEDTLPVGLRGQWWRSQLVRVVAFQS